MDNKNNTLHVYDGIEEENNPMPGWWSWLFILTAIFSFLYALHYTTGGGPTLKAEYAVALEDYKKEIEKNAASAPADTEETLIGYMKNENFIHEGAGLFKEKCAMCHGANLEGKIGPNLTDEFWTTGAGTRLDIVQTIKKGSTAKGMPAWETILKPNEIKNVAAFVFSKIGSDPVNPKAAEGQKVK